MDWLDLMRLPVRKSVAASALKMPPPEAKPTRGANCVMPLPPRAALLRIRLFWIVRVDPKLTMAPPRPKPTPLGLLPLPETARFAVNVQSVMVAVEFVVLLTAPPSAG